MICGAFIEARSCERFALLGDAIGAPLRELFQGLHEAEARHYQVYLKLAGRAALRAALDLQRRIEEFAHLEAELITSAILCFAFIRGRLPERQACVFSACQRTQFRPVLDPNAARCLDGTNRPTRCGYGVCRPLQGREWPADECVRAAGSQCRRRAAPLRRCRN